MWLLAAAVYGWFLFNALANLLLMRRPRRERADEPICFEVLIPARNEADKISHVVLPLVNAGVKVTVYDDESSDGTAEAATSAGAVVLRAKGPLPPGWVGKNRACYELAQVAMAEWVVFLDADTIPAADFAVRLSRFLKDRPAGVQMVSGFPRLVPGAGFEPLYLGWVPWILLCLNPFGIQGWAGIGHPRFTNGQFGAWRREVLLEVRPHEALKGEILEDVKIGRLMARLGRRLEVVNVSSILSVRMYSNLREAIDGMSKNSGDIVKHPAGSLLIALLFLFFGWGWAFAGHFAWLCYAALTASKFFSDRIIRYPLWTIPFLPITCALAAFTIVRALYWKRMGSVAWKGRIYPS